MSYRVLFTLLAVGVGGTLALPAAAQDAESAVEGVLESTAATPAIDAPAADAPVPDSTPATAPEIFGEDSENFSAHGESAHFSHPAFGEDEPLEPSDITPPADGPPAE